MLWTAPRLYFPYWLMYCDPGSPLLWRGGLVAARVWVNNGTDVTVTVAAEDDSSLVTRLSF